jgi:MoxR-like ATPase
VRKLKPDARGSILCFVGPPGVGKTSLGRSIARALGREFERISAGGMRDESEIRGHRRTYIGAMPGTIIRALRDAGSNNPLFMIDELDKMGSDYRGDPSSAMLEVLDPEQNATFRDHYLDVPFDLSNVMFITTANELDRVPGPLRDRMEIITLAGYTEDEKLQIARRYLVPRQVERNGLKKSWITISDAALRAIISGYTREAGVRGLEREIGTLCRKVARQVAEGDGGRVKRAAIGEARARELLGRQRFFAEAKRRTRQPGVATGLAWTPVGGDVLFIEATAMPGKGHLTITGQLGDVMKESAQAALSYVRGHVGELAPALGEGWFAEHDLHVHVPAGAIPKDGPSGRHHDGHGARVAPVGPRVRDDVAMTGEITLTGQVLPSADSRRRPWPRSATGDARDRPARNEADVDDIPEHLRRRLKFRFVEEIGEVLDLALEDQGPGIESARTWQASRGEHVEEEKRGTRRCERRAGGRGGQDEPVGATRRDRRGPARQRPGRLRVRATGLRAARELQEAAAGRAQRQEAPRPGRRGGRGAARRGQRALQPGQAGEEEAQWRPDPQAAGARRGGGCGRRRLRRPAQQAAGPPVRCRGGVRLHVDHRADHPAARAGHAGHVGRAAHGAAGDHAVAAGAPGAAAVGAARLRRGAPKHSPVLAGAHRAPAVRPGPRARPEPSSRRRSAAGPGAAGRRAGAGDRAA